MDHLLEATVSVGLTCGQTSADQSCLVQHSVENLQHNSVILDHKALQVMSNVWVSTYFCPAGWPRIFFNASLSQP